jgi:putative membrane-bound dehydrogenase-like protein
MIDRVKCLASIFFGVALCLVTECHAWGDDAKPIKILFVGDKGHHQPEERFRQLVPVLNKRGIDLTYRDGADALNAKTLAFYHGLIIYANITKISPEQESALIEFVEGGKGFIPIHCASYCFLNSQKYVDLVGAQFLRHGTGTFRTVLAATDHPVMKGFSGFESWDETYVHTKHNEKDRTVLEYRVEGQTKEPWTWVRTQGKGRVFYTAWGHDHRTWAEPGFQNLIERGIRWATGNDPSIVPSYRSASAFPIPEMTPRRNDVKPFEYVDVGKKIPNYTLSRTWGTQGESFSKMQLPLPPEESLKHMVVPKGFHVELFASEKDFGGGKPICMTWDERGRLWVALTFDYPNEPKPPGQGRDRIVICEDTDGDGRADKFTVFAEKLNIPTSMLITRGGVIVFDAGETVFLKDTDGDDKADVRDVLFGTWSRPDTHGTASNMQYGLDNWIWAMQGYNRSRLRVGGEIHDFRQGFLRFRPDASKLEFIRSTDNNTWGLGMSEEGIIFGSTANGNPSVYMPIPNRYYEAVRGWAPSLMLHSIADSYMFSPITDKVRQVDYHGGYTAGAGHALYTARNYPKEYWNRTSFVAEPTGHLVGTFVLRRDGSHFRSNNPFNLVASDDEWTAPIMAEVGPDGNVWVIDWYNFIVQHNPTPQGFRTGQGAAYESDLRDKKHGRIYRIVCDSSTRSTARFPDRVADGTRFSLAGATPQKLVETLRHDNMFWRRNAQRLLVERGQRDVLPLLFDLARDSSVDEIGLNVGLIHAIWTIHGLGALDGSNPEATSVAVAALKHQSPGVRRNAVQVLPRNAASVAAILDARLTSDPDSQVRLATFLALADQPETTHAAEAVITALSEPANMADRWIPDAVTCAAAKNGEYFLQGLATCKEPSNKSLAIVAIVAEHYARGKSTDAIGNVVSHLADSDPQMIQAVVRGLAAGWPSGQRPKLSDKLEQDLERLAARLPAEQRGLLVKLAVNWGSKRSEQSAIEVAQTLLKRLEDESLSTAIRLTAASELVEIRGSDQKTIETVLGLVSPSMSPDLATGIVASLRTSDCPDTGRIVVERLPQFAPSARAAALTVLLTRPMWTKALLQSADHGEIQLTELRLDQKQSLAEHPDLAIRQRARELLKRGGALPSPDRQKVLDEYLPITKETGDPVAGKAAFKNHCSKCHIHGGEGTRIGPDLTGMAVHPKEHLLMEILDPSRSVEANFRAYRVTLKKGTILQGLLASETQTAIELFDAEGKKQSILRQDIEELQMTNKSLMPDGFEKQLSRKELTDVLEFLAERGKYVPLPLDRVATAVSTRGMFYGEQNRGERLVFDDWTPKTVHGVPFQLVDPLVDRSANVVLLYGPEGTIPPKMPKSVALPCNVPAKGIHMLGGISGWGYPLGEKGSVTLITRLHYADGQSEDHELKNGEHFADYIRRVDVPGSEFAFNLRGRQVRYLAIKPRREVAVREIEFIKGPDGTAPIIVAVTIETP